MSSSAHQVMPADGRAASRAKLFWYMQQDYPPEPLAPPQDLAPDHAPPADQVAIGQPPAEYYPSDLDYSEYSQGNFYYPNYVGSSFLPHSEVPVSTNEWSTPLIDHNDLISSAFQPQEFLTTPWDTSSFTWAETKEGFEFQPNTNESDRKRKTQTPDPEEEQANEEPSSETRPGKRTRRRFDPAEKERMKATRQRGSCLRCAVKNLKCIDSDSGACRECIRKSTPSKPQECVRAKISDIEGLVRNGPTMQFVKTYRWLVERLEEAIEKENKLESPTYKTVKDLKPSNGETKEIEISQGSGLTSMFIKVRQFAPVQTVDCAQIHTWHDDDGQQRSYHCDNWAISNVEGTKNAIIRFMASSLDAYLDVKVVDSPVSTPSSAPILPPSFTSAFTENLRQIARLVFGSAREYCNNDTHKAPELVHNALKFWHASRFIEDPWTIEGNEALNMTPQNSPIPGKIPITPMMDFQLDNLVINSQLKGLLKQIRKDLKEKMFKNKPEDWYDCYLTAYVLLDHVERTFAHDVRWARRHGLADPFSNKPLIKKLKLGARTLLDIFHHQDGSFPFSEQEWPKVRQAYAWSDRPTDSSNLPYLLVADVRSRLALHQNVDMEAQLNVQDPGYWTSQLHSRDLYSILKAKDVEVKEESP